MGRSVVRALAVLVLLGVVAGTGADESLYVAVELQVASSTSMSAAIGDVDLDGDLDVLVVRKLREAMLHRNDGFGAFQASDRWLPSGHFTDVALADLDGDGDLDAVLAQYNGPNLVLLNGGIGGCDDVAQSLGNGPTVGVCVGDLDAVIPCDFSQSSVVLINDGTGRFNLLPGALDTAGENGISASLGDVDGDGDPDAFFARYGRGEVVWFNTSIGPR